MMLAVPVVIYQLLSVVSLQSLTVDVLTLTLMMLLYTAVSILDWLSTGYHNICNSQILDVVAIVHTLHVISL